MEEKRAVTLIDVELVHGADFVVRRQPDGHHYSVELGDALEFMLTREDLELMAEKLADLLDWWAPEGSLGRAGEKRKNRPRNDTSSPCGA